MSAALGLFRLQQVDNRINQVEQRLTRVRETLGNDTELRTALDQVRSAQKAEYDSENLLRSSEEEARDQRIKIQQAESSLYGGIVRNPKELQELQADISALKKHLSAIEERELEAMLGEENRQSELQAAEQNLKTIESRRGDEHRKLIQEQDSLARDLENLMMEREAAISAIDKGKLAAYESLRQQRRGVAVAEISENACGACGTTLTAALQQSARHVSELVLCPSCGRILFAN